MGYWVEKIKKNLTSFNIVFLLQFLTIFFACLGVVPKEAVLFSTGLVIFYVAFSPIEEALVFVVSSIPFFVALPITETFDSMANWRLIISVLFLSMFLRQGISVYFVREDGKIKLKSKFKHFLFEYLVGFLLIVMVLSLFVATDLKAGIKKILFVLNVFLLFDIIRNVVFKNRNIIIDLIRAIVQGGAWVLVFGFLQLITVFFVNLYGFWQWWDRHVIDVFYGENLSNLLSYSNTWFSYYENALPTLRMFSIFPDSHSFAMFCIIVLPFVLFLAFTERLKKYYLLAGFLLGAVVLSGTRGAWLSGVMVLFAVLIFWIFQGLKKKEYIAQKFIWIITASFFSLLLFFPVSSVVLSFSRIGNIADGEEFSFDSSVFKRAESITDAMELSNMGRLAIWKRSLESIAERPLLGVGIGNFPIILNEPLKAAKMGSSAHSLYLDMASEIGILGLIIFLIAFFIVAKNCFVLSNKSSLHAFFLFYFLWVASYSLFDVVLLNDKVFLLFVSALAVVYSLSNDHEEFDKKQEIS